MEDTLHTPMGHRSCGSLTHGELIKREDPYDRIVGAHPTPPMWGGGHTWRVHLPERPTGVGSWPMDTSLSVNTLIYPGAVSVGFMGKYLSKPEWWKLEPHPEFVKENPSPFCLADPGNEYLFYLRYGGSVKLDLSELSESANFKYQWTDLVNSRESKSGNINGGSVIEIKCPEDYPGVVNFKDWVLHLKKIK